MLFSHFEVILLLLVSELVLAIALTVARPVVAVMMVLLQLQSLRNPYPIVRQSLYILKYSLV